jgi:hypothetical protein
MFVSATGALIIIAAAAAITSPWSGVLFEKLIVVQLVKNFPALF